MTGRNMTSSFSIEDVKDDEKSAELVLVSDPSKEKFKKFSDVQLDDEIKKFEDLANSVFCKKLNLKDGGDKIRRQLQRLLGEKSARVQQQCSVVRFLIEGQCGYLYPICIGRYIRAADEGLRLYVWRRLQLP